MKTAGFVKLKLFLNLLIIPTMPFLLLMIILPGSLQLCPEDKKLLDISLTQRRHIRSLQPKTFINGVVPGTKWCGAGNIAKSHDDLGIFANTDSCCREHDQCKDSIEAGKTKYGLTNPGLFVWSHCDCDKKFRECLRNFNDFVSRKIGFIFFTVLGPKCFKEDYPKIGCKTFERYIFKKRCIQYETNQKEGKIYQWFDNPFFY